MQLTKEQGLNNKSIIKKRMI